MTRIRKLNKPGPGQRPVAPPAGGTGKVVPGWRRHGLRLALLWAGMLAAYSNSFNSGLIFDNAFIIGGDPRIRAVTLANICAILNGGYWHTSAGSGLYRPLTTFTYLLNYAVLGNGSAPAGYHWVNLALHGVNVALVYSLGILIFETMAPAWALAAIWGLHPALTESVTNIVGRADLLSTMGVLAGLLCYVKSASATGRSKVGWITAMVAAQTFGIFSKESAAVLPAILLLYDLLWRQRDKWRERAPAYLALILPFALFFYTRSGLGAAMRIGFADNPLVGASFLAARLTAVEVIGKLSWLFAWPARLSADYSYNAVPIFGTSGGENIQALLALAVSIGAIALAIASHDQRKPVSFFIGLFFLAILPSSNLFFLIGTIMADRFLYLPSIGLAGCLVWALWRLKQRQAVAIAVVLACFALAARTYARNIDWQDALSLWHSAVDVSPENCKAHNNLGIALLPVPGRLPDAIEEFQTALRIYPEYTETHFNLASAFARVPGKLPDAISEYQAALRIYPEYLEAHSGLAQALARMPERRAEAIAEYRAALEIKDSAKLRNNLGVLLAQTPGRTSDAISEYQAALRLEPDNPEAHLNLGAFLAQVPGRLNDAVAEYQSALRLNPNLAEAHFNLGNAFAQMPGHAPDAIAEFRQAIRIRPDYIEAHNNLAIQLVQIPGQLSEAVSEFREVARLRPRDPQAHTNLARTLLQIPGGAPEAIAEFEKAFTISPDPGLRQMIDSLVAHGAH